LLTITVRRVVLGVLLKRRIKAERHNFVIGDRE
jgi:hypothetical protein